MSSETKRWEQLGERDPYWAVCVEPKYRGANMTDAERREFFESGEREVAATFARVRELAGPQWRPARALDFGCGVGRLTLPIAAHSGRVTGVDISEPMLREARKNADARGAANVEFVQTDAWMAGAGQTYDFIHSYIVFQHIPPATGMRIARAMVHRLEPGGIGALHFSYARRASLARKAVNFARRHFRPFDIAVRALQGLPPLEPSIPMYQYDLAELFALLSDQGCHRVDVELTDHGGFLGAMLYFRRNVGA